MKTRPLFGFLTALSILLAALPMQAVQAAFVESSAPADLLQFTAGGHVLGFATGGIYAATGTHALHVDFMGANISHPQADSPGRMDGKAEPLGRVTYANLWDGIDLVYSAGVGSIYTTTYTVAPGADPADIRLRYNAPLTLNEDGTLSIAFETGVMIESAPKAWQEIQGQRVPVDISFQVSGQDAGFVLGVYDPRHTLMIDPNLTWNTFLGGSGSDGAYAIAVDGSGNVYVAGRSYAAWGSPIRAYTGNGDAFTAKLNASTGALTWNTFLGGSGYDQGYGIAVDGSGNVYVAGSSDATWGSPVRAYTGDGDAFAAKLNASTGALTWNTFLGGSGYDYGNGIAVDGSGNVYVAGASYATWGNPVRAYTGGYDAFAAKLNASTGTLTWNTFLGGSGYDYGNGIAVDGSGNVYVTGYSNTTWGSPVRAYTGDNDAFAAKLNASTGALTWNTFLGGSGYDYGNGIAVDGSGNVYLTGYSNTTWGSPVRAYTGGYDAFAAKLNSAGSLIWNTFLGGSGDDYGNGIAVDGSGNVYTAGYSTATWGSPVRAYTGLSDAFVARLDPVAPGAFSKTAPAGGSYAVTSPTVSWGASSDADEYEYCYDTSNNNTCNSSWISTGTSTTAALSGLGNNDTYYWQVRATNGDGTTEADGGTWWSFTARNQTFADVPIDHPFWAEIEAFYNAGITTGCGVSPLRFCPDNTVTRAAMAVFLLRAKYGSEYEPPPATHTFSDLPVAGKEWQEAWVDQFYLEGITSGCGVSPLRYCPENAVTRAAMAVFILRTLEGAEYEPPEARHYFSDLPVIGKEWMEAWVDEFYDRGITGGCGTGPLIYCPENPVKRQGMAAFIVRAFGIPLP